MPVESLCVEHQINVRDRVWWKGIGCSSCLDQLVNEHPSVLCDDSFLEFLALNLGPRHCIFMHYKRLFVTAESVGIVGGYLYITFTIGGK